jgi:hypothetical protein
MHGPLNVKLIKCLLIYNIIAMFCRSEESYGVYVLVCVFVSVCLCVCVSVCLCVC